MSIRHWLLPATYSFFSLPLSNCSTATAKKKITCFAGLAAWALTLSGLVSGMFWAQIGWGSYWSWDPKETSTLLLFITASISIAAYHEEKFKIAKWISLVSCLLSIVTVCISFIITGLHSFI
jgi:ABC-type transport system involved in cytochrome c biogenesis permease subunit